MTLREEPVPVPLFNMSEKRYINDALREYRNTISTEDSLHIDSIAVIIDRDGILYEFQFWILWRAILFYKLGFPVNPIYANSELVINNIISKCKEVISRYGLYRDEGSQRQTE